MITLKFSGAQWQALKSHLTYRHQAVEEAAFAFMQISAETELDVELSCIELRLLTGEDLSFQSAFHIEVSESTQAEVIKHAHDLKASLVEAHSHVEDDGPGFSRSDFAGFSEFVPHVFFRLKGRPYAAVVMSNSGFDALGWWKNPATPSTEIRVEVEGQTLTPSGRTWIRPTLDYSA